MLGKIKGKRRGRQRMRMVREHHQLNGHEFEQTPGDNAGQGNWCAVVHWVTESVGHLVIEKQQTFCHRTQPACVDLDVHESR